MTKRDFVAAIFACTAIGSLIVLALLRLHVLPPEFKPLGAFFESVSIVITVIAGWVWRGMAKTKAAMDAELWAEHDHGLPDHSELHYGDAHRFGCYD